MCINIKDKARNITFFPHSLYPYITFPNVSDVDPSLFQVHTKPPTILIAGDSLHSKSPSDDKVEILFLSIVSILVFCKQTNSTYSFIIQALITLHLIFPPNPLTLWLVIFIKYSYHVPPPSLCNYFFQFEIYPFFFFLILILSILYPLSPHYIQPQYLQLYSKWSLIQPHPPQLHSHRNV